MPQTFDTISDWRQWKVGSSLSDHADIIQPENVTCIDHTARKSSLQADHTDANDGNTQIKLVLRIVQCRLQLCLQL